MKQKPKMLMVSLGCDKNLVDSEIMLGLLAKAGYAMTGEPAEAEVIVINTCGFIAEAQNESFQTIEQYLAFKESGVCRLFIVTGCLVEVYETNIIEAFPGVDAVVGTANIDKIAGYLQKLGRSVHPINSWIDDSNNKIDEKAYKKRIVSTPKHMAYLKIAEGCDNRCTYCTIPSIRGSYRSRSMDSLIAEAEMLAESGVKELILVAQDTSLYGIDLYKKKRLSELLRNLSQINGIEWIRLMYCYPEHITNELILEIKKNRKICHYIDMPIQHSSDKILNLMNRRSSNESLRKKIDKLRHQIPDIVLRTTLIVGFPGEDRYDYNELCEFVKEVKFDRLGVFMYSREQGTPAYSLAKQIKSTTKINRRDKMMQIQQEISKVKLSKRVGTKLAVLVEGYDSKKELYYGRSYMDSYSVDGLCYILSEKELEVGDFTDMIVDGSNDYDLFGHTE